MMPVRRTCTTSHMRRYMRWGSLRTARESKSKIMCLGIKRRDRWEHKGDLDIVNREFVFCFCVLHSHYTSWYILCNNRQHYCFFVLFCLIFFFFFAAFVARFFRISLQRSTRRSDTYTYVLTYKPLAVATFFFRILSVFHYIRVSRICF